MQCNGWTDMHGKQTPLEEGNPLHISKQAQLGKEADRRQGME